NPHRPRGRAKQAGEALDGRGLAGAVWSEKSIKAAGRDSEIDSVDRAKVTKGASQPGGLDGKVHLHGQRLYRRSSFIANASRQDGEPCRRTERYRRTSWQ